MTETAAGGPPAGGTHRRMLSCPGRGRGGSTRLCRTAQNDARWGTYESSSPRIFHLVSVDIGLRSDWNHGYGRPL